jgi:hypothetical protein
MHDEDPYKVLLVHQCGDQVVLLHDVNETRLSRFMKTLEA